MTSTHQITLVHTLAVRECPVCGVAYALPQELIDRRQRDGGSWYCPNGHSLVFTTPEVDKLRKERDAIKRRADWAEAQRIHERDQRQAAERSAAAYKGQATRLRTRAAAGVCPCCNRSFENLRRHMTSKHPDFGEAADGE